MRKELSTIVRKLHKYYSVTNAPIIYYNFNKKYEKKHSQDIFSEFDYDVYERRKLDVFKRYVSMYKSFKEQKKSDKYVPLK